MAFITVFHGADQRADVLTDSQKYCIKMVALRHFVIFQAFQLFKKFLYWMKFRLALEKKLNFMKQRECQNQPR